MPRGRPRRTSDIYTLFTMQVTPEERDELEDLMYLYGERSIAAAVRRVVHETLEPEKEERHGRASR